MTRSATQVVAIAEGHMEFPVSDLWRMGDHHMVTRIAQRVCEQLAHFVAVRPHPPPPSPSPKRLDALRGDQLIHQLRPSGAIN